MTGWRPPAPPPQGGRPPSTRPEPPAPDPAGMDSVLMRARDRSRFQAPVIEEEQARPPFPWRPVLLVFSLVIALAVAGGAAYVLWLRQPEPDPDTIVQVPEGRETVRLRSPQDAARDYLQALADGDIRTALSLGEYGGIGSRALLNSEVHARMRERAPLTDIAILTEDPNATDVEVSYTLAGEPVRTSIPVVRNDAGGYELERTTVTVVIELAQAESLPLRVNGVDVQKFAPLEVVPGFYEVTTGLTFIEYPQDNSFLIGSLGFASETRFTATPRLTTDGEEALRAAVRRSLDDCFARRQLAPEGCPQSITAPQPVAADTIRWRLIGNPLADVQPTLLPQDLSRGTMTVDLRYSVTFDYLDGSTSGTNTGARSPRATANMLGDDPSRVNVVWQQ